MISHLQKKHSEEFLKIGPNWSKKRRITTEPKTLGLSSIGSQEDLINQVMIWIVRAGLPFSTIEDPVLRNIFEEHTKLLMGRAVKKPFPKRDYFRERLPLIHKIYEQEKKLLIDEVDVKIALTTDIWTSTNSKSFIGFTAHWITSNYEIKRILLAFSPFPEKHSSENILEKYLEVVRKFNISDKVKTCLIIY